MLAGHSRKHTTHVTHAGRSPTQARHPRSHATHATHATHVTSSPTQARHPHPPRHPHKHATHASTLPTPPTLVRHPRKHATHATHASASSTPFHKLNKNIKQNVDVFTGFLFCEFSRFLEVFEFPSLIKETLALTSSTGEAAQKHGSRRVIWCIADRFIKSCLPHDLLAAKLFPCGFGSTRFLLNYLTSQKHRTRIAHACSSWENITSRINTRTFGFQH